MAGHPLTDVLTDGASCLDHLQGGQSGQRYPADRLIGVDPLDGRPLLARYDLDRAAGTLTTAALAARRGGGIWRWAELLPVRNAVNAIHLGEGATPLLPAPRLGRALGTDRLHVKAEGINPTGSFKARGMAAAVSRALELGVTALVAPSGGNAGGALAAYGAAAGLPVTVLVPVDIPAVCVDEAMVCGARVILVEGLIDDCGRLARLVAETTGAFDVSTMREPYRVEGKKTMALELAEDLGWRLPDAIVYPTGGGTGIVGMAKAFDELIALGLVDGPPPRLFAAQTQGCAPFVRAFAAREPHVEPWPDAATRASGIRVPRAVGDVLVLEALRSTRGGAVAVTEDAMDEAQLLAGRSGLGYVAPETATALAVLRELLAVDELDPDDEVVVFDTGIGHKYPPPPGLPDLPVVQADEDDGERLAALAGPGGDAG